MFAKLFSRITESSLMEEPIEVRYVFVMLLAICDPTGHVIGTDVAIARRINMPVADFTRCVEQLKHPDPDSNSKEEDGRRVVNSEGERGYKVVNYLTYREMRDEHDRREYMRDYMKKYRENKASVKPVKPRKQKLTALAKAEEEAKADADNDSASPGSGATEYSLFVKAWMPYYKARTGGEYPFNGRDGKAVNELLAHFKTGESVRVFIKACHARALEGFPFGATATLYDFSNNIARLQDALAKPPKINGTHQSGDSARNCGHNAGVADSYANRPKRSPQGESPETGD